MDDVAGDDQPSDIDHVSINTQSANNAFAFFQIIESRRFDLHDVVVQANLYSKHVPILIITHLTVSPTLNPRPIIVQ